MEHKDDIYKQEYLGHKRIQERRKFAMADLSGEDNDVVFEVNWNSHARKNGFVKIMIGDTEVVVSREHLWGILFMLGDAEEQEKIVTPFIKKTIVKKFYKMIGVTTTRDVKKGEQIHVPLEFTLNPSNNQVIVGKGSMDRMQRLLKDNK